MNQKSKFVPLEEAVQKAGGQTRLANICAEATGREIKQGHVSNWLKRHNVPSDCAVVIERSTGIAKEILCPGYAWHVFKETAA
jgi:hypothetical protein